MLCQPGEMFKNGKCKCGTADSCLGNRRGEICDSKNSQCMCSKGIEACKDKEYCLEEVCSGIDFVFCITKVSSVILSINVSFKCAIYMHSLLFLSENPDCIDHEIWCQYIDTQKYCSDGMIREKCSGACKVCEGIR